MNLLLLNYEYPPLGGGASVQIDLLSKEFTKKGHQVYIVTSHFKGYSFFEKEENIFVFRIPVFRKYIHKSRLIEMFLYILFAGFLSLILNLKIKFNHQLAFFLLPTGLIAFINRKLFGTPYVVSLRGGDVPSFVPDETPYYKYFRNIACVIGQNAERLVAVSSDLAELAKQDFPTLTNKITNIDNGIKMYPYIIKREKNTLIRFLFAGRLTAQKNLENIIRSFSKIKDSYFFDIYGDGPLKNDLLQLVNGLKLADKITLHPWIDTKEIEKEMQMSDFLVLLSHKEGLSMTALQAYRNGLPIIASKVCGLQDFVTDGKTGFMVDIESTNDYSSIFEKAIHYDNWHALSINCQTAAAEKFNITQKAEEYIDLFNQGN
jgi:glycosyltransferase involved in cell wall biosynthesis